MRSRAGDLSDEQAIAAASGLSKVFIEAGPGSGKTKVAVQVFGAQRMGDPTDGRSVVALSFTRSATAELRSRIRKFWGPRSLLAAHRICTLDTFLNDILTMLLASEEIGWPEGHTELNVIDDWKTVPGGEYGYAGARLTMDGGVVGVERHISAVRKDRIQLTQFRENIEAGTCSHEDVRRVLELYISDAKGRGIIGNWLRRNFRCVIVDEVFDANHLDIELLRVAADAEIDVIVIGDPWQALYGFRGARPDLIPELVAEKDFKRIELTQSYRFQTKDQLALVRKMRGGNAVELSSGKPGDCDVVLAHEWGTLWSCSTEILPIAIKSGSSSQWAIATVLLHAVLHSNFGTAALHAKEAFRVLGIADAQIALATNRLESVVERLSLPNEADALRESWDLAATIVFEITGTIVVGNRAPKRLQPIRARVTQPNQLIVGMTVHQSKGREWDNVGVVLTPTQLERLSAGLTVYSEPDRVTYVALTRARRSTVLINERQTLSGTIAPTVVST